MLIPGERFSRQAGVLARGKMGTARTPARGTAPCRDAGSRSPRKPDLPHREGGAARDT